MRSKLSDERKEKETGDFPTPFLILCLHTVNPDRVQKSMDSSCFDKVRQLHANLSSIMLKNGMS